ncbi:hypothetical protein BBP40_011738 [Aspergillus hancockii]|nr:hypothetical protein BBP40_011738 [Aspergillus hancockii]
MVFAVFWYTILCVALNEVVVVGGSNLMSEEDIKNLTPELKADRVKGSKWVYVSEHSFVLAVWAMKACMLVIYARITYQYYEIIQGCISISADIFMLLIGLPLLLQVRVPLKQKLILVVIFGMGIFVIVAAVLTKVYCLVPSLISYVYMNWYFREATVAVLVTNLPLIWSLLRDVFPALKSWTGGSKRGTDRYRSGPWTSKASGYGRHYGPSSQLRSGDFNMHDYNRSAVHAQKPASDVSIQASDDRDISDDGSDRALRIRQDVTVTVERESRPPEYWGNHNTKTESPNGLHQPQP